jgi:hypothetical protein
MLVIKTTEKLLNALDKVPTSTLTEKHIKQAGIDAMMKQVKINFDVDYKPGKGFKLKAKKVKS